MKAKSFGSFVLAAVVLGAATPIAARNIIIYTQKINAEKICGSAYDPYSCSTTLQHMRLSQADISLERDDAGQPVYEQVLGRTYVDLTGTTVSLSPCAGLNRSMFAPPSATSTFTYKRKASTLFNAGTDLDVKSALTAAGVPASQLNGLEAKFKATYGRKARAEYEINGVYFRLQLNTATLDQIKGTVPASGAPAKCGAILRADPNRALIYSIAIVQMDNAKFASNVATDIATDFAAQVKNKVQNADVASLKLSIQSSIEKSLTVKLSQDWRVVSWDYLTLS